MGTKIKWTTEVQWHLSSCEQLLSSNRN